MFLAVHLKFVNTPPIKSPRFSSQMNRFFAKSITASLRTFLSFEMQLFTTRSKEVVVRTVNAIGYPNLYAETRPAFTSSMDSVVSWIIRGGRSGLSRTAFPIRAQYSVCLGTERCSVAATTEKRGAYYALQS